MPRYDHDTPICCGGCKSALPNRMITLMMREMRRVADQANQESSTARLSVRDAMAFALPRCGRTHMRDCCKITIMSHPALWER